MITPGEAFTELVLEVFQINGRLLTAGDRLAAPVGLTSARWQVLGAIDAQPLPVSQIARAMGLTRQSVQRTVDVLAREGVVAFTANPQHKRAKLVGLTAAGRAMYDRISLIWREYADQIAEGAATSEILAAIEIVRALRQRLERRAAEDGFAETDNGDPS